MPSPFPGMDPYLEGSVWMSVHTQLSAEIVRQLAPKLRPKYLALTNERYVGLPNITVEIRDAMNRRLVTVILTLTPGEKRGWHEEYLAKRNRILVSTAHLMEIDLLHEGQRAPVLEPLPPKPYYVLLSRARMWPRVQVWPIALSERLPIVPVPLLAGDPDVELDLQRAFTNVYDLCGYDLAVDYRRPPEVKLPANEADWVEEYLRTIRGEENRS